MNGGKFSQAAAAAQLERDCTNLSFSSRLFSLVAKKTVSSKTAEEVDVCLNRLTFNQIKIFGHIVSHSGATIRVKQLAYELDITAAAASQAIDRLVSIGVLERRTDPDDRRSTIIRISKRGNEILSEYQEIYNSLLGSIYNQIDATPEDIATFGKVLSQIHLALKQRWEQYLETKAAGAI